MSNLPPFKTPVGSRRAFMVSAASALTATSSFGRIARAAEAAPFKLGTLPLGTATWEAATISGRGLDKEAGIALEVVKLASNEAARIAFVAGSVDTIVSDLIFAARLRAEGRPVRFLPYSTSEGGVMIAGTSSINSIADLRGKTIGVAGGPLDKSWILLRAAALQQAGLDLQKDARPVFGAPPLLSLKLEDGELDAALLYWNFCARLQAKGFKQLTSAQSITTSLGIGGPVALLGYLVHENVDPVTLLAFAKASRAAKTALATQADAWTAVRGVMDAPDQSTFDALKQAFISGIPRRPRDIEINEASALFALLAKLGGSPLVGAATTLPAGLYVDQTVYG